METLSNCTPGSTRVRRLSNNYTNGREGTIIECDEVKKRARVHWMQGTGAEIKTWVSWKQLLIVHDDEQSKPSPLEQPYNFDKLVEYAEELREKYFASNSVRVSKEIQKKYEEVAKKIMLTEGRKIINLTIS